MGRSRRQHDGLGRLLRRSRWLGRWVVCWNRCPCIDSSFDFCFLDSGVAAGELPHGRKPWHSWRRLFEAVGFPWLVGSQPCSSLVDTRALCLGFGKFAKVWAVEDFLPGHDAIGLFEQLLVGRGCRAGV